MEKQKIKDVVCKREGCNYDWTPRVKGRLPKQCPKCKRYDCIKYK